MSKEGNSESALIRSDRGFPFALKSLQLNSRKNAVMSMGPIVIAGTFLPFLKKGSITISPDLGEHFPIARFELYGNDNIAGVFKHFNEELVFTTVGRYCIEFIDSV